MHKTILLSVVLCGCAVSPAALPSSHPATSTATPGRLAPAPASLRVGVVAYPDVPKPQDKPAGHHHHDHP